MDYRAGVLATLIANSIPRKKGDRKTFKPGDFFPSLKGDRSGR